MSFGRTRGITLLELIVVLVILAIGSAFVLPTFREEIENRQAKQALATLRTISQAVRLYQLNELNGSSLPATLPLTTLENAGYLNSGEYAKGFTYQIDTTSPVTITAATASASRTITLQQHSTIKSQDGAVTDDAGFLNPNY